MRTMLSTMLGLAAVVLALPAFADESYHVPHEEWVHVLNESVKNSNQTFLQGAACAISKGGKVWPVATKTTAVARVRYTPPGNTSMQLCPKGTEFYLPYAEMRAWEEQYRKEWDEAHAQKVPSQ